MHLEKSFSQVQQETFEKLMSPESSWPEELRDRFDQRRSQIDGYIPHLDREVVSEYVQEKFD